MEILYKYRLPRNFKPVATLCNEIENNLYIEYNCLSKILDGNYHNIVDNLTRDIEIEDDVDFIVRMQHECDIADSTTQEKAEWYYALAVSRTLENYKKFQIEYDKYTDLIRNYNPQLKFKIHTIKTLINQLYHRYIYETSLDEIAAMITKMAGEITFENIEKLIQWDDKENVCICNCNR